MNRWAVRDGGRLWGLLGRLRCYDKHLGKNRRTTARPRGKGKTMYNHNNGRAVLIAAGDSLRVDTYPHNKTTHQHTNTLGEMKTQPHACKRQNTLSRCEPLSEWGRSGGHVLGRCFSGCNVKVEGMEALHRHTHTNTHTRTINTPKRTVRYISELLIFIYFLLLDRKGTYLGRKIGFPNFRICGQTDPNTYAGTLFGEIRINEYYPVYIMKN